VLSILSRIIFNILLKKASESSSCVVDTARDLNVDLLITTNHVLNEFLYNLNLANCVNELTRFILVYYLIQLFIEMYVKYRSDNK